MAGYDYDPLSPPDPAEWLALDEFERMLQVDSYHQEAGIELPDMEMHATMHVIIENQVAMGMEAVVRTMDRLQREGLDRHEAVHAIGCVLAEHLHAMFADDTGRKFEQPEYLAQVEKLSARSWRKGIW